MNPQQSPAKTVTTSDLERALGANRGSTPNRRRFFAALEIKEKLLGSTHPDIAVTLHNLGLLLQRRGNLNEAATLYERALAIFERSLAPPHPKLVTLRANYEKLRREIAIRFAQVQFVDFSEIK